MELNLETAAKLVDVVATAAKKAQAAVSVAVVDAGGHLVAMKRLDGASAASAEICRVKAETACLFGAATKDLSAATPLATAMNRPLALLGGGIPLRRGSQLIGGIGVAGGAPDDDHALASAAAATLT